MGPTWVLSAPDGPHVGPMNLAIRDSSDMRDQASWCWIYSFVLTGASCYIHIILPSTQFARSLLWTVGCCQICGVDWQLCTMISTRNRMVPGYEITKVRETRAWHQEQNHDFFHIEHGPNQLYASIITRGPREKCLNFWCHPVCT